MGSFSGNTLRLGFFIKTIYEGAWISVVVFIAMTKHARAVAVPLVAVFVVFQLFIAKTAFDGDAETGLSALDGITAVLSVAVSVAAYVLCHRFGDDLFD